MQGAGSSQQLLLPAPEQVAGGDVAAVGAAQACSLPSSHRLQAAAGADGGASNALLAASQAFYQVNGGIQADCDPPPVVTPQNPAQLLGGIAQLGPYIFTLTEAYSASMPDGIVAAWAVPVRSAVSTCIHASLHQLTHSLSAPLPGVSCAPQSPAQVCASKLFHLICFACLEEVVALAPLPALMQL